MHEKPAPHTGIIDTKVPVTWLISTIGALIVGFVAIAFNFNTQAGNLSNKMDAVLASNLEMKGQLRDREAKLDTVRDSIYALQRLVDAHALRITAVEKLVSRN